MRIIAQGRFLQHNRSLALVSAALLCALAGAAALLAPRVSAQVDELIGKLPRAFGALTESAGRYGRARRLIADANAHRRRGGSLRRER